MRQLTELERLVRAWWARGKNTNEIAKIAVGSGVLNCQISDAEARVTRALHNLDGAAYRGESWACH